MKLKAFPDFKLFKQRKLFYHLLGLFLFLALWQILPALNLVNPDFLPSFLSIITKIPEEIMRGSLQSALVESFIHYGIGLGIGLCSGIPLGIVMGRVKWFESLFYPIEELFRPIPPIAWIPIAIVWLGFTPWAAGFIIFVGAFFPTLINTYDGVKSVSRQNIEAAMTLGVRNELTMIKKVVFPASLPNIFTGIRISNAAAWMCLVAAEMFGAGGGMGLELTLSRNYMDMERIFAYMFVLGVIGLLSDIILRQIDSKILKWRKGIVAR